MSETFADDSGRPKPAYNFHLVVSALFVLIIALLAVLWTRERSARIAAQRNLAEVSARLRQQRQLHEALTKVMRGRNISTIVVPFQREDLVGARQADLDGRKRRVLEITGEAGRRLGFQPGDVIVVSTAPTPATQAATTHPPATTRGPEQP